MCPKHQAVIRDVCAYINAHSGVFPERTGLELVQDWLAVTLRGESKPQVSPTGSAAADVRSLDRKLSTAIERHNRKRQGAGSERGSDVSSGKKPLNVTQKKVQGLSFKEVELLETAMKKFLHSRCNEKYTAFNKTTFREFLTKEVPCLASRTGQVFDFFDEDGSGRLEFREFVAALLSARNAVAPLADASFDSTSGESIAHAPRRAVRPHSSPIIRTLCRRPNPPRKTLKPDAAAPPNAAPQTHKAALKAVSEGLVLMQSLRDQVQVLSTIGSPTDDDLDMMDQRKASYDAVKLELADALKTCSSFEATIPLSAADKVEWSNELVAITEEGDERTGSVELVRAMLTYLGPATFRDTIGTTDVFINQCVDGNYLFLEQLLQYTSTFEGLYDVVDLVASACFSQTSQKVAIISLLLAKLDLAPYQEDLQDVMTDLFCELIDPPDTLRRSSVDTDMQEQERQHAADTKARHTLMTTMLSHPHLSLALTVENAFVNCCKAGEPYVLKLLLEHIPYIVQPTQLLDDGTAPILHAIRQEHDSFLEELVKLPGVDLDVNMVPGTPLGIARALGKSSVARILSSAGATVGECNLK